MKRLLHRLLALSLTAAFPLPAFAAQTYALVVGVDEYPYEVSLDGAVRDAEDVYASMSAAGFTVKKFTNAEARKDDIRKAWTDMVAEAAAGDTIIFTYAGHGAQMPELIPGDEADGLDEFLQLPGFDRNRFQETFKEIIVDNEMNEWFAEAEAKGVHVLFVSDSCFSGGMSRSITGKTRLAPAVTVKLAPPSQEAIAGANLKEVNFKQVTVLAASLESQPTPEVIIDGEPRGALSWSFARAVEGSADRDGNGIITRIELEDYIFSNVKNRSEALQVPNFMPQVARSESEVVVTLTRASSSPRPTPRQRQPMTPAPPRKPSRVSRIWAGRVTSRSRSAATPKGRRGPTARAHPSAGMWRVAPSTRRTATSRAKMSARTASSRWSTNISCSISSRPWRARTPARSR